MGWLVLLTSNSQLFMHVLKIHNVKLDYSALALAMGNGESVFFSSSLFGSAHCQEFLSHGRSSVEHPLLLCLYVA